MNLSLNQQNTCFQKENSHKQLEIKLVQVKRSKKPHQIHPSIIQHHGQALNQLDRNSPVTKKYQYYSNRNPPPFPTSSSPLPQQQRFFPSLHSKPLLNPLKMKQLLQIKHKQYRQGITINKKLHMYKQLLQKQSLISQSKQKYLNDRLNRYDRMRNVSFLNLRQKLKHQNRFNQRSVTVGLNYMTLEQRASSLYFRTLDDLDGTIRQVTKSLNKQHTINKNMPINKQNNKQFELNDSYKKHLRSNNFNYRYLDNDMISNEEENQKQQLTTKKSYIGSGFQSLYSSSNRTLEVQQQKQKHRVNQMVKLYREYQMKQNQPKGGKGFQNE